MELLNLILAVIALIVAILAYQKAGGVAGLKKQIDHIGSSVDLRKSVGSLATTVDSLMERTAEAIGKFETTVRGKVGSKARKGTPATRPKKGGKTKP